MLVEDWFPLIHFWNGHGGGDKETSAAAAVAAAATLALRPPPVPRVCVRVCERTVCVYGPKKFGLKTTIAR